MQASPEIRFPATLNIIPTFILLSSREKRKLAMSTVFYLAHLFIHLFIYPTSRLTYPDFMIFVLDFWNINFECHFSINSKW